MKAKTLKKITSSKKTGELEVMVQLPGGETRNVTGAELRQVLTDGGTTTRLVLTLVENQRSAGAAEATERG